MRDLEYRKEMASQFRSVIVAVATAKTDAGERRVVVRIHDGKDCVSLNLRPTHSLSIAWRVFIETILGYFR